MTFEHRVRAVAAHGFTERQARFLVAVMLHAGVCMDRHYCAFARIAHGQNTTDFFRALIARRFATAYTCAHGRARIYHLHHRALYQAIGEPHSRFRKPTPIGVAIERLMLLDAVLSSPCVSWLATASDKMAHFSGLLRSRLRQEEMPHLTFGSGREKCVRYFPDKLPIGVSDHGRGHILGYLVTRAVPVDFRAFLLRHAELLRALGRWVIRLWIPGHFREAEGLYRQAWDQEFGAPLRTSTVDELRWFFAMRRSGRSAPPNPADSDRKRFLQARRAFSAPRYRVLYRAWLREGSSVVDATCSPALADAIDRGDGRLETEVLARSYLHLSSLVGTS